MCSFMHPTPTRAQQQQAFADMRSRIAFANWPTDLDAAMADPWRARLINVNAWALAMRQSRLAQHRHPSRHADHTATSGVLRAAAVDLKRAAAGDRD